jgi:shikimate dehydrogenase
MTTSQPQQCMVIGDPVSHSLSPAIHTAGYAASGLEARFTYTARPVAADELPGFIAGLRGSHLRGLSVTTPHKEAIRPLLDSLDEVASQIGAVNTVVHEGGRLLGTNTDWIGAVAPLSAITKLRGKSVAVIGAGGAAKAFVYGLTREGAKVTVYNRTLSRARALAAQYGCNAGDLSDTSAISQAQIICNTTSAGLDSPSQSPLPAEALSPDQIVFDATYFPYDTKLLLDAEAAGARVVHGTEMLLHQGLAQFELFAGHEAPEQAMREALMNALAEAGK